MIVVGEKINAGASLIKNAISNRDEELIIKYARDQEKAGAQYLDISVAGSVSNSEEKEAMAWAVGLVTGSTECGVCIDSTDPEVWQAGLEVSSGRPTVINSTTAEEERLRVAVELSLEYDCSMVALAMGKTGIPRSVEERLDSCKTIWSAATGHGVSPDKIYFDPLVLTLSTDTDQAVATLETLECIVGNYPGCGTIMGLSNISHGLPNPSLLNCCFLSMAIAFGLTAVILNPFDRELMSTLLASRALVGKDPHCAGYLKAHRAGLL